MKKKKANSGDIELSNIFHQKTQDYFAKKGGRDSIHSGSNSSSGGGAAFAASNSRSLQNKGKKGGRHLHERQISVSPPTSSFTIANEAGNVAEAAAHGGNHLLHAEDES